MGVSSMRRNYKRRIKAQKEKKEQVEADTTSASTETEEVQVDTTSETTEEVQTDTTSETTEEVQVDTTPLPEDFPGYEDLIDAEPEPYTTYESLEGMTQDDLTAIHGIGKVTANKILEALNEWQQS